MVNFFIFSSMFSSGLMLGVNYFLASRFISSSVNNISLSAKRLKFKNAVHKVRPHLAYHFPLIFPG